jgi:hypothetical protein
MNVFLENLMAKGYDYTTLTDFVEDKGLPEFKESVITQYINHQGAYLNPLFVPPLPKN